MTPTSMCGIPTTVGPPGAPAVRVNDDATTNSQFLPKIALDPTTGDLAVVWYDSRNDLGTGGPGDTDGIANDDAQLWGHSARTAA